MNFAKVTLLTTVCSVLAVRTIFAASNLTVHSGGTLIVHTNVQVNSGTFTVESGGTLKVDLGSKITATNIVYGGTLTVSSNNLALAAGQTYQLFSAPSYSGAFLAVNLPTLATSLVWTNGLSTSGSVSVKSVASTLQFSTLSYSPSQTVFSGSGGSPNTIYWVLTTTNLNTPTTNWTVAATGAFSASGNFSFTNAVTAGVPQKFFLLQVP